jgi:hypothetical protein
MQWVAGPSPSYQAEHHQIMLYGNLLGRQTKLTRLINDLWRHVTKGQRASSEAKAVVKSGGAELPWLFTLSGSKNGVNAISLAYQSALNSKSPTVDLVAPKSSDFLPPAHEDLGDDLCTSCPVKSRCAVWHEPES